MLFDITIVLQAALWIWFFGCIVTYKIHGLILVGGMGVKSAEFLMLCLYSLGLAAFYALLNAGKWILLAVLLLWFIVQFFCHWYYTIFGASPKKLKGYNACLQDTVRLLPVSETRLIPDLYHILLHGLILLNILCCIGN